jgi:hypothetical protein
VADLARLLAETISARPGRSFVGTRRQRKGAVGDPHNIGKADLLCRPCQLKAALASPAADKKTGLAQLQQNGFQEFGRNMGGLGDFAGSHPGLAGGQNQHGAEGIMRSLRKHPRPLVHFPGW